MINKYILYIANHYNNFVKIKSILYILGKLELLLINPIRN